MYQDLVDKKAKLALIGLGYVGLPIALELENIRNWIRHQCEAH